MHGNCNVKQKWKGNLKLANWCGTQRTRYRKCKLSTEQVSQLEQLGFIWDPHAAAWEEMFLALAAYKGTHGNCNVPREWKDNSTLGMWCTIQRRKQKNKTLLPDRIKRLKALGFRFEVREPKKI